MRAIGFRSNILFAIAAAFGIIASLDRPWYEQSPSAAGDAGIGELPRTMEGFFNGIGRAFGEDGGTSGWDALETADTLIAGLAIATVLLLVLTLVPPLQLHVQALARWTSLATLGVVVVKLFDEPGTGSSTEPRQGLLIALGCAAVLVASAVTLVAAPRRRRATDHRFIPPAAPAHDPDSSAPPA